MIEARFEIRFSPDDQTEPLLFEKVEALEDWLNGQVNFWGWLRKATSQDSNLNPFWEELNSTWTQARQNIQSYKTVEERKRDNVAANISQTLSNFYARFPVLLISSSAAQFVEGLRQTNAVVAAHALHTLARRNKSISISNSDAVRGITLGTLFQFGVMNETTEAHQAALAAASDAWTGFQSTARQEHAADKAAAETLREEMMAWRTEQTNTYQQLGVEAKATFDRIAQEAHNQFDLIQKTYNEQLGLQAPVKYWEDRAHSYLYTSIWFSLASVVVAALAGVAVWAEVQALVIPFSETTDVYQFSVHAWRYAFVIASAAFFVWPIRILVRILLSAVHLRIDAKERATLAKTYLSFLHTQVALDQKDRHLVLEILFRPASTGIVKDDAAPTSVVQLLSRLGSGDKR